MVSIVTLSGSARTDPKVAKSKEFTIIFKMTNLFWVYILIAIVYKSKFLLYGLKLIFF